MEKDDNSRSSAEFPHELRKHDWYHVTDFVEEDADSIYLGNSHASESFCEFYLPRGGRSEEVRWLETVLGFGGPLVFLTESP